MPRPVQAAARHRGMRREVAVGLSGVCISLQNGLLGEGYIVPAWAHPASNLASDGFRASGLPVSLGADEMHLAAEKRDTGFLARFLGVVRNGRKVCIRHINDSMNSIPNLAS